MKQQLFLLSAAALLTRAYDNCLTLPSTKQQGSLPGIYMSGTYMITLNTNTKEACEFTVDNKALSNMMVVDQISVRVNLTLPSSINLVTNRYECLEQQPCTNNFVDTDITYRYGAKQTATFVFANTDPDNGDAQFIVSLQYFGQMLNSANLYRVSQTLMLLIGMIILFL